MRVRSVLPDSVGADDIIGDDLFDELKTAVCDVPDIYGALEKRGTDEPGAIGVELEVDDTPGADGVLCKLDAIGYWIKLRRVSLALSLRYAPGI